MGDRRRTFRVHNAFEHRLILQVLLTTFVVINLTLALAYYHLFSSGVLSALPSAGLGVVAGLELVGLAVIYALSLKASRKATGPVYAFRRKLEHLKAGDLASHDAIRAGDYFRDVEALMDEATRDLAERIERIEALVNELGDYLPDDVQSRESYAALQRELAHFRPHSNDSGAPETAS